jgi:hypothetical protein
MPRSLAIVLIVALLPGALMAGGKKAADLTVTFHLEASAGERKAFKQLTSGKEVFYRKSPEISTKDIIAFRPFPSDDGNSYGMIFQLNKTAAGRLSSLSNAERGKLLLSVVNGQARDAVVIDPVGDALIVIWKRIALKEIHLADQHRPRIGEDVKSWKKRLKDEKKKKK